MSGGGVHEYEVLGQLLDVLLQLRQLPFAVLLLVLLAQRVDLLDMGQLLVFLVHDLPLLLQRCDQLLPFFLF